MKTIVSIALLLFAATSFAQQKETFDLATYTVLKDWKKISNTADGIGYAITNKTKGTYCQVAFYKSMATMGSAQLDFETDWQDLIVKPYKATAKPDAGLSSIEDGWERKTGYAPFEFSGAQSLAMLVTMSGYTKRFSIVILTNTEDYKAQVESILESVDLRKPETTPSAQPGTNTDKHSILGTWNMTTSDQSSYRVKNGVMNYIIRQYTFNDNGTYSFITKTFDPLMDKILFGKENGTFQISGSNLTIIPQKSVLEAWSKKDGTDKWGKFLSTQNVTLEKVLYQFTKHYFSGIQEWSLVLQANAATKREGPFSNNTSFTNAYYYSPISSSHPVIELPRSQTNTQETKQSVNSTALKSTFIFNTTTFDDGWTSTEQENWVEVKKGAIKVLIHYPNKNADAYNSVVLDGLKIAWDILVAPKYSTASNFEFKPISGWQTIEFAEADCVEKTTSKTVHVVLFKMNYSNGSGKYLEFITANKKAFEQEFGVYHQTTYGWDSMEKMANYNKFSVALADLKGKWTSNFTGMTQYVNAYTGADAGATSHASSESFEFMADNSYHWEIAVASGVVGNTKFQNAKSSGKLTQPNNWQIHFSDLEGKPKTYNAFFSCVKGTRILWLEDSAYAIGYSGYGRID